MVRVARSAQYARAEPPESVDEAIVRIGFKEVTRIVAHAVMHQLARPLPLYGETADFFWRKSMACALAMDLLAARHQQPAEQAYLTGLLHAIGEIMLQHAAAQIAPDAAIDPVAMEGPAPQELRLFGLHQGNAAARCLETWDFPPAIIQSIAHQFDPAPAAGGAPAVGLLARAKHLSLQALGRSDLAAPFAVQGVDDPPAIVAELKEALLLLDQVSASIETSG